MKTSEKIMMKAAKIDKRIKILLKEGRYTESIKYYRSQVKCSLEEAKDYVDMIKVKKNYE